MLQRALAADVPFTYFLADEAYRQCRTLQQHQNAITVCGAQLVAVSPQIPDESLSLVEKEQLAFEVLSDVGSEVAKQFGIAFDLSCGPNRPRSWPRSTR